MNKDVKPIYFVDDPKIKSIHIDDYEISLDPQKHSIKKTIPTHFEKEYLQLLEASQLNPKGMLEKVLDLKNRCLHSPEIDNLLCYLYIQNKNLAAAEKLIEQNFFDYPDYFFAKINFADQMLRKKKFSRIKEIFPFDELKNNFKERTHYHVSEYRSFMVLMSRYHSALRNTEKAYFFYQKALKADPAHHTVVSLERELYKKSWGANISRGLHHGLALLLKIKRCFLNN
ncbi:MAG: hypothetical protein EBZ47_03055 [Chlamydiae bacterium]|nr:hypothetical protein [Chlamydiota bacterium]